MRWRGATRRPTTTAGPRPRDRLFRRGGRGGSPTSSARSCAARRRLLQLRLLGERNFRGFDGRADALLDRYAGRHLPAAALHAARAGLHGADGRGAYSCPWGSYKECCRPYRVTSRAMSNPCCSRRRASCCWRRAFWLASRFTLHTTHRHILFVLYIRGLGMGLTFAPPELLFVCGTSRSTTWPLRRVSRTASNSWLEASASPS